MNPIQELSLYGASVTRDADNIKVTGLGTVPPDRAHALLAEVKARKPEILSMLRLKEEGFTVLEAADGDVYEVVCDATDMKALRKWKQAMDEGLIVLSGKVQYLPKSNIVRLRYRCAAPTEWLPNELRGSGI